MKSQNRRLNKKSWFTKNNFIYNSDSSLFAKCLFIPKSWSDCAPLVDITYLVVLSRWHDSLAWWWRSVVDISFRAGQSGGYCDLTTSMTQEQRRRGCITSHQSSWRCAEDINVSCFRAPSQQNTHFCCRAELQVCFLMPCVILDWVFYLYIGIMAGVCGSVHNTIPVIPRIFGIDFW